MSFIQYYEIAQQMLCPGYLVAFPHLLRICLPQFPVGTHTPRALHPRSQVGLILTPLQVWPIHLPHNLASEIDSRGEHVTNVGPFRSNPRTSSGNTEGQSPFPLGLLSWKNYLPVVPEDHVVKKAPDPRMKPAHREASRGERLSSDDITGTPGSCWANPRI